MLLTDDILLALVLAMKLNFITSAQLGHITHIYQLNEWISLKWQKCDETF